MLNISQYRKATCQLTGRDNVMCVHVTAEINDFSMTVDVRKLAEIVQSIDTLERASNAKKIADVKS
jgi:hypothetical protein